MPTKKKSVKKPVVKKVVVSKPQVTSSNGPTYDTIMIITILLLLFVYPLGLIFMWAWMKTWPVWLKIVISLPFIISVVFLVIIFSLVRNSIREGKYHNMVYEQRIHMIPPAQGTY